MNKITVQRECDRKNIELMKYVWIKTKISMSFNWGKGVNYFWLYWISILIPLI